MKKLTELMNELKYEELTFEICKAKIKALTAEYNGTTRQLDKIERTVSRYKKSLKKINKLKRRIEKIENIKSNFETIKKTAKEM